MTEGQGVEARCVECDSGMLVRVMIEQVHPGTVPETPAEIHHDAQNPWCACPHCGARYMVFLGKSSEGLPVLWMSHVSE